MGIATDPIPTPPPGDDLASRQWRSWIVIIWLVAAMIMICWKWTAIHWFALGDTDDNMRMSQVRALLRGQDWFDLRQHKLDPPAGANIHWSRLVDLPIAGLILLVKPFVGGAVAEKVAVAIAPLLPLGVTLFAIALAARRLVAPAAFGLAALLLFCGQNAVMMWMPLRLDHHGWQLALLATTVAGLADPKRARGGATLGLATAASLTIGLEALHFLALAGGVTVFRWVAEPGEALRLRAYGAALAAGSAAGYLLFASWDNRLPVCDALSPVWLSAALAGGGLLVALAALSLADWRTRLGLAGVTGVLLAGGFALAWPHCLARPEGVSPELYDLWLSHVREAKPVYQHGWRAALPLVALPVAGLVGTGVAAWRAWGTRLFAPWAAVGLLSLFSAAMLLWQTRAGPGAQLLAVPGATALGWTILPLLARHRNLAVRVGGTIGGFLLISGLLVALIVRTIPEAPPSKGRKAIASANRRCPTLPALRPIAKLPAATILTMVDFGPRLITITHHRAIAGPYHRNQAAILDVHHAFRSSDPAVAHDVMRRHGATLLLICPGMSETTIYASEAKNGFYAQLRDGRAPGWLTPVALPKGSPFKLWRMVR